MDRCVTRVQRSGKGKQAAIAICYTSITGTRKERAERFAERLAIALKEPNYGARAGQTIAGNLARGGDGKFTRADGSAASGRDVINALTARPKKSGSKRATVSAEQQAAAFERAGVGSDAQALRDFAAGTAPSGEAADRLVSAGLAERGRDGQLRMTSAGRGVVRAAKRGDAQAAADAASRGRDAVAKRGERAQAKVDRETARAQAQAARQAERDRRRAETERRRGDAQSKRNTDERQRIGDRADELVALVDQDENVTSFEREQRVNRLEDLSRRLERAGGDDTTQRKIDQALRKLRTGAAPTAASPTPAASAPAAIPLAHRETGELHVFKQGDTWRWLGVSSNAYEDREREIVSAKALEADAERMDADGTFGPLRWWHVGEVKYTQPLDWTTAIAGPGLDIGTCDFSMVVGRMAVEGGSLHPAIGPALAEKAGEFQMSRGFAHPADEPDASGVYHHIRTFERSLLPRGKAANPFTAIQVNKESDMATTKEKIQALADRFFGGDAAKAEAVVADVTAKDKEIEASGVAFKGDGDAPATTTVGADVTATMVAAGVPTTVGAPVTATVTVKADGAASVTLDEVKADGEGVEVEVEAEGEDMSFVGDMTIDELVTALAPALAAAIGEAMKPAMAELDATKGALAEAQKELSALKGVATKEAGVIASLDQRVKELEGDAPGQRGYRATTDAATVRTKEETGINAPQTEDEVTKLVSFMLKG